MFENKVVKTFNRSVNGVSAVSHYFHTELSFVFSANKQMPRRIYMTSKALLSTTAVRRLS